MRFAKDFRRIAWDALEQNYWIAVIVTLVATVLGGALFSMQGVGTMARFTVGSDDVADWIAASGVALPVFAVLIVILTILSLLSLIQFLVGGAVNIGLSRYNLGVVDGKKERFSTLFTGFDSFAKALGLRCWMLLFTLLWSLLFVVPGIIAAYRYSMAPFIMAENPDIGIREAVRRSKMIMHGNKLRLFRLQLSFFGWYLLTALSLGIGSVFLAPYVNAAVAAFYLEVSGQGYRLERYAYATAV